MPTHRHHLIDSVALTIGLTIATVLAAIAIHVDLAGGLPDIDLMWFVVATVLMLVAEFSRRLTLVIDASDTMTLRPVFAYGLVLLGAPSAALAAAILGFVVCHAVSTASGRRSTWFPLADLVRTLTSVAAAGLVLTAMGVDSAATGSSVGPWWTTTAVVAAGLAILLLDAVITELAFAVHRRMSFELRLRRGLAVRSVAMGSLLSLAPLWVIGLHSNAVLMPLLVISTALVIASTRRSLARTHEALNDPLTGLANRRSFDAQLADACAHLGTSRSAAVMLMDLNDFKQVNDRLGHDVGDALLVAFAERLEESLPSSAIGARLGGDEFAVLLCGSLRYDRLDETVEQIRLALDQPLTVAGFPISIGVSIGVATAPHDGHDGPTLVHAADIAMYRSKRLRTKVEAYDGDDGAIQTGRLGMLADLGGAVAANELRVDYQPQVAMGSADLIAVEALVRWEHPEHGTIAPNDFIGLAEQTDLIGPVTHSIIRMATAGLNEIGEHHVRLAVNVSVRNLQDPDFARDTLEILELVGFAPQRLELEITEQALLTNPERSQETIAALRAAGVRITLDGFGTGYASYQTLRSLRVDRIKIDRDFVLRLLQDEQDQAVVRSIAYLAHELGLEVVAEGVESMETWDLLADIGCDAAQGYGIAMPMGLPILWTWMSRWRQLNDAPLELR